MQRKIKKVTGFNHETDRKAMAQKPMQRKTQKSAIASSGEALGELKKHGPKTIQEKKRNNK